MKFVYELYFKIYGDINIFEEFFGKYFLGLLKNYDFQPILNVSFINDFLNTDPDFELRIIFFSLLVVLPTFFGQYINRNNFFEFLLGNFF